MKMITRTLFLLTMCFIFGACQGYNNSISQSENLTMHTISKAVRQVQKKYPLSFSHHKDDKKNEIVFIFETSRFLPIADARIIILDTANIFLNVLRNTDYFPSNKTELQFVILTYEDGPNPILASIILRHGFIEYSEQLPEDPLRYLYIDETVEEALRKVKEQYEKNFTTQNIEPVANSLYWEKSMILMPIASGSIAAAVHLTRPTPKNDGVGLPEENACNCLQKGDFDKQMCFATCSTNEAIT